MIIQYIQGFKKYSSTENELDSRKSSLAYSSVESRKSSTLSVMSTINHDDDGLSSRKASDFDLGSGGIGSQSRKGSGKGPEYCQGGSASWQSRMSGLGRVFSLRHKARPFSFHVLRQSKMDFKETKGLRQERS